MESTRGRYVRHAPKQWEEKVKQEMYQRAITFVNASLMPRNASIIKHSSEQPLLLALSHIQYTRQDIAAIIHRSRAGDLGGNL